MAKEDKVNNFVDISKKIHEEISKSANSSAVGKLVEKKVDEEITRRVDILEKGLVVWNNTQKELAKCKPDVTTHMEIEGSDSGTAVQNNVYSDAKYKEKCTLKKRLADIEVALMLAFGDNQDYNKLSEIVAKNGGGKENKGGNNKQETKPESVNTQGE
jgi:hypothetical protein